MSLKRKAAAIGIVGTAKNTGKTTAAISLMEKAYNKGISIGLTGIGYDGEELDNITLLPKPRYFVRGGTLVATAETCFNIGSAVAEALVKTGFHTTLGEVIIGRIKKAGTMVVAGPNTAEELNFVIEKLKNLGGELLIVDGSINRIAPMVAVDGLILTAGAARDIQIGKLAQEIQCICRVFSLPVTNHKAVVHVKTTKITIFNKDGEKKQFALNSLLVPSMIDEIVREIDYETKLILIPGLVEAYTFRKLVSRLGGKLRDKTILFSDPTKLLVSGNFDIIAQTLIEIRDLSGEVQYIHKPPLIAIAISPFYPRYSEVHQNYEPAYVDSSELMLRISRATHIPVIDTLSHNGDKLWRTIYSTLFKDVSRVLSS